MDKKGVCVCVLLHPGRGEVCVCVSYCTLVGGRCVCVCPTAPWGGGGVCVCMSDMSKVKSVIGRDGGAKLRRPVLVVTVTTARL